LYTPPIVLLPHKALSFGGDLRELIRSEMDKMNPPWSPNGKGIALVALSSDPKLDDSDLYLMEPNPGHFLPDHYHFRIAPISAVTEVPK